MATPQHPKRIELGSPPNGVNPLRGGFRNIKLMSKYGKSNRHRWRQADQQQKRQFEDSLIWQPDPEAPIEEKRNNNPINATTRVLTRTVHYRYTGQIIEFAVVVDKFVKGEWEQILCIDTCNHGSVHRHINGDHKGEPELISPLTSQSVIQEGYWEAIEEAYNEAERE